MIRLKNEKEIDGIRKCLERLESGEPVCGMEIARDLR